jgi:hypothetical protein
VIRRIAPAAFVLLLLGAAVARADARARDCANHPVRDVKVNRDETGWTLALVIPFKSLRYPTRTGQVWGHQRELMNRGPSIKAARLLRF